MSDESTPPPPLRLKPRLRTDGAEPSATAESSPPSDQPPASPATQDAAEAPKLRLKPKLATEPASAETTEAPAEPAATPPAVDAPAPVLFKTVPETPATPVAPAAKTEEGKFKLRPKAPLPTEIPAVIPPPAPPTPPAAIEFIPAIVPAPTVVPPPAPDPASVIAPPLPSPAAHQPPPPGTGTKKYPPPTMKSAGAAPAGKTPPPAKPKKPANRARLLAIGGAGVVLLAAAAGAYFFLLAEPEAPPPLPPRPIAKQPAAPASADAKSATAPAQSPREPTTVLGQAVQRAQQVVQARSGSDQVNAGSLDDEFSPRSASRAVQKTETVAVAATTELAPGVVATTTVVDATLNASEPFRQWVASARISGVFQGTPARVLINNRTVSVGQSVNDALGIKLDRVDVEEKRIIFRDTSGAAVERRY